EFDGLPLWQDDVECSHDARFELDTTLHVPEPEGWLDFSSVLPTVEILQPRELADNEAEVRRDGGHNAGRYRGDARRRAAGVGPRIRRVSARLAQLGRIRPVVPFPSRSVDVQENTGAAHRAATLPPIWLMANIAILLAVGLAVLPRIMPADAAAGCRWYRVKPGDTLGNLGWANHSTALKLAAANNIKNPDLIYVGQQLCIPMTSGAHVTSSSPKTPASPGRPTFGSANGVNAFINFLLP